MALSIITLNTTDNGSTSRNTLNTNFANILASYPTSAVLVGLTDSQTLTNKTLTSPIMTSPSITWGSDANGDIMQRVSGAYTRLGLGSNGQVLTSNGALAYWNSPSTANTNYITDTGVVNAYVATLVPAIASYTAGQLVQFKCSVTNTGASTLNVNGLGTKTIKKADGVTDLVANDIKSGQIVTVEYDGTNFQMTSPSSLALNSNGDGSSLTNLTAIKLTRLAGYTAANNVTENTVFTTTITGGLLSINGMIRFRTYITASVSTSADTITIRMKYGGSTLQTITLTSPAVGGGSGIIAVGFIEGWINNNAATNSQNVGFYNTLASQVSATTNQVSVYGGSPADTTSAIDTTTNQTLTMTVQKATGTAASGTVAFSQTVVETIKN